MSDNKIHPTAIIGPNVKLGKNNYIGPYCVLSGKVEIGDGNVFFSHVAIGAPPQHKKFTMVVDELENVGTIRIGNNNTIHEFVTIHQPYVASTVIGSDCFIMAYAHVSHDTQIEDGVTIANCVQIGGHSVLMKGCNLGLSAVVHQFTVIGTYTMLGMGSAASKHLIPFGKFAGTGPKRIGLNKIGLERLGFDSEKLKMVEEWSSQYLISGEGIISDPELRSEVERYEHYISQHVA